MAVIQDPYTSEQAGVTVTVPRPTGATATDTPNVTAAITAFGTALASGPATLKFQDGTYQVDGNSLVIRSMSNFTVTSSGGTVIELARDRASRPNNVTGDIFVIADCTNFTVSNLTIDGLRDTIMPITPLSASASSGQPSVTVAAGSGALYTVGQRITVYGGLGTADQNLSDSGKVIQSITPGGGGGGGDLITFTGNLTNSYGQISSTMFSDGYGPYACAGDYLTFYQTGNANSVAGRSLGGEDQQNGLHLLNCQQFTVNNLISRNLWESGIKCGTGFSSTILTDGCSNGTISDCITYHGYDQGVSLWVSDQITITGCVCIASGWAGISMTMSDYCSVVGNQVSDSYYRVPGDDASGSGICVEGGQNNHIKGNTILSPYSDGMRLQSSPILGVSGTNAPTVSNYLAAQTAAGTSIQVSSTTNLTQSYRYSLTDGARTEAVSIASIVDNSHVTFNENIQFSHAAGTYLTIRIAQDNQVEDNTILNSQESGGVQNGTAVRTIFRGNYISGSGVLGSSSIGYGISMSSGNSGGGSLPSAVALAGHGAVIEGNRFGANYGQSIYISLSNDLIISNNWFSGSIAGHPCLEIDGCTDCIISNNHFNENGGASTNGVGIYCGTSGSGLPARMIFSGNHFSRLSQPGLRIFSGDSITVTGNVATSCGGNAGIDLLGVSNSVIQGNVCNSNSNAGILLENNSTVYCIQNRVVGNTCRDDGSGYNVQNGNSWTQAYGINETGNSNNNLFLGNEVDSNGTSQLATVGTGSVSHYNIISGTISA
jgi:parallel beta-helix repeat protein